MWVQFDDALDANRVAAFRIGTANALLVNLENCGGCGVACKEGEICWRGACGCPKGFAACGNECKNLATDDDSCGACDTKCTEPPPSDPAWVCGPGVQPPQTMWGCDCDP